MFIVVQKYPDGGVPAWRVPIHGGTKAADPESHLLRTQTPAAIDARNSTGSVRFREIEGIIRDLQSGSAWSETDFERL